MKKRLAYLCGSDSWGGLEMNQLRNAMWMKDRGHDVCVLCWEDSPLHKKATESGLTTFIISKHKKYFDFANQIKLVNLIKKEEISHLILRLPRDMSLGSGIKSRLGKKLHLSYFMEMQLGIKKDDFLHTLRFKRFDLWACPLNYLLAQVKAMTRFDTRKLKYIPSGIDLSNIESDVALRDARIKLDLPQDAIFFGLIGRIDCQKGQNLLFEAFLRAVKEEGIENINLCFLGEPTKNENDDYFQKLIRNIECSQLKERVFIRPFMEETATFYKAMNWTVMASKAETFGMVTVESLAHGVPVLGSNRSGTLEILGNNEYGLLFQSMDEYDLSRKIIQISQNQVHFDQQKLKERAAEFDKNHVCSKVEEALKI